MIIDAHVHHHWSEVDAPPWPHIEATVSLAQRAGIHKLGLLGTYSLHGVDPTPIQIRTSNSNAAKIVARYPDTVYSLCYLNPAHDPRFIEEEVDRCVGEAGMKGIKQWIAVNARDERMAAVMEGAARHNVPVFFHAWYKTIQRVYHESSPADIRDLALRYPHVTIVMLHLIGGRERGVLDVKDLPNVYIDTSGSQPEAGYVEFAVAHLGAARLIFGSDAPLRDYGTQLAKVTGAHIDAADKAKILGQNAVALLGL
jgi:uncharacterized protein